MASNVEYVSEDQIESDGYYIEVFLADGLQYFGSYILGLKDVSEVLYRTTLLASSLGKVERWAFYSRTEYKDGSCSESFLAGGNVYYLDSEDKYSFTVFN